MELDARCLRRCGVLRARRPARGGGRAPGSSPPAPPAAFLDRFALSGRLGTLGCPSALTDTKGLVTLNTSMRSKRRHTVPWCPEGARTLCTLRTLLVWEIGSLRARLSACDI